MAFLTCLLSYISIITKVFIQNVHILMGFTSPVSSVILTGHSVSDFTAVQLGPLGKPVGASSGQGEEVVSTSGAAGDCLK